MWFIGPAAGQYWVHYRWAELRFGESDSGLQLSDHLTVLQPEEWLLSHWKDFPHTHTWVKTRRCNFEKLLVLCPRCTCACRWVYFSPNIQTSPAVVKRLKLIDSGAIHLIGSRLTEAAFMRETDRNTNWKSIFIFTESKRYDHKGISLKIL